MKNIYVLWVRHCISCSNVAAEKDIEQRYRKEPLCTSEGIVHAIVSGDNISKYIKKTFPGRKVKIFSSFLPRAMETAKLISSEMIEHGLIGDGTEEIRRLPFISEIWSNYEIKVSGGDSSTSTTTREKSDAHARFLNTFFQNTGLKIDDEDSGKFLEIERECPRPSSMKSSKRCKLDIKECYKKFLSHFVIGSNDCFSEETVNVIVSHGAFIEKYIIMSYPKKTFVDNVDAALVVYEVYDDFGRNDEKGDEGKKVEQKLLHYLKSPSNLTTSDRRIILKLNSYEMKNILKLKFSNCEYTYDDIYEFSR